jgi:hypothetical protein
VEDAIPATDSVFCGYQMSGHRFRLFPCRAMVWRNGTTLPKTAPDSYRLFDPAPTWLRLRWMSRGAVLSIASDMALFGRGDCQEAFAKVLEAKGSANGGEERRTPRLNRG